MKGFQSIVRGAAIACMGLVFAQAAQAATGTVRFQTSAGAGPLCLTTSSSSISVDLQVDSLSDAINGVQVRFSYAPAVLSFVSATPLLGFSEVNENISGGLGTYALVNSGGSVGPAGGPFTVATLVFDVEAEGNTAITFQADSPPFITKLTTATQNPVVIADGSGLIKTPSGAISVDDTAATAANNGPICEGSALNLTGGTTGSAPNPAYTFSWSGPLGYSSGIQSPQVSASATPGMSGTYTLTVTNGQGCTFQANTSVTVNPNPVAPTSAATNLNNFCSDDAGNISLTATGGSGTTLNWYTDSCGGTPAGTGSPLVIASPTVTTTYFARWETPTCGNSTCASVTVTVNQLPTAPTSAATNLNNFCSDDAGNISLTATGGSGTTLNWYTGSCGGTFAGTGSPLVIPSPAVTTTYFARWETATCTASACASVTVTVNQLPTAPASAATNLNNFCSDDAGNISLTATGGSGTTLNWYTGSCGGTFAGTGSPLVIPSPAVTTTYFARWETATCTASACASVTVTVNQLPTAPASAATNLNNFCSDDAGNISLTATGGSGTTLNWYTDSCGGTFVGAGSPLVIPSPAVTTTYFARWETATCTASSCASVTVTVNASPVAPTGASVDLPTYCSGAAPANIELTATGGSGDSLKWYSGSCGGTSVGTGTPLSIAAPATTTTYFARWETTACGNSACASVTVTVNASPVAPTGASVDLPTYCSGAAPANIELTATGGSGDSLKWYSGSCGGTSVGTGTPLSIAAPATTTTYFARWETTACGNSACASVTVTVNASPVAPTGASVDLPTYCSGAAPANIELTATGGSGDSLKWYSGSCGGTSVGTGTPLSIAAPATTTTYFARWETTACGNSACASVAVTVITSPVAPTSAATNLNNFCSDDAGNISLTATGGLGVTLNWYTDSCGGTPAGTGSPLVIASPTVTTTYFARWETPTCGNSTCASVTVTVNQLPTAPTSAATNLNNFCSDDAGNISLTATGGSGTTLNWYTGSCGGTFAGTGSPLVIPSPAVTTTYFARWETATCTASACASVTVTVNQLPTAPASAATNLNNFCSDDAGNISLTATGGSGTTLNWYTGSCGGTFAGTGSPLVIPSPAVTTTYFARWETATCTASACASVTVTVNQLPTAPASAATNLNNFCSDDAGNISLTATGGSGTTLNWYTDSCGGTFVGAGSPLVIPSPAVTTTYFARWETASCTSSTCASVTVTVNQLPTAPASASSDRDNFCSDDAGNISLSASGGSGSTLNWYTGSCGGASIGTGSPLVIASPAVTTTYFARWETASCTSSTCASVTVTVTNCVTVNLEIPGLIGDVLEGEDVATRAVYFDLTTCSSPLDHRTVNVDFKRTDQDGTATVVLTGVDPAATWMSVVEGHTLRRLVAIDLSVTGSDVKTVSLTSGDFQTALVSQDNLVDIVDFSILATRWNQMVADCGGGNPEDCFLGADATGDGVQDTTDFTFIMANFFMVSDGISGCPGPLVDPGSGGRGRQPIQGDRGTQGGRLARKSITKGELSVIDTQAASADFNGDNVIDAKDIRQFAQEKGLTITPMIEAKLQQMELPSASVISPKMGK